MRHRLIAAVLPGVLFVGACGPHSTVSVNSSHSPAPGYRLFLQQGFNGGSDQITVVNSISGTVERQLPVGTPAPDWSRLYVVVKGTSSGTLKAIEPSSGQTLAQTQIPPGFFLPDLTGLGPTAGLSPNGKWLAITRQVFDLHGTTSSILVGDSSLTNPFKQVDLNGDFSFDALSNDGSSLYLIQKMSDANHYRVRLYSLADQSLAPGAVVDKREPNEAMNGIRGDSIAAPSGDYLYTVYIRDRGPFIHALPLQQRFAFCIDLPSRTGRNGMEEQFRWSLAVSADGSRVYAANGSLGTVSVMSTTGNVPAITRTAELSVKQASSLPWLVTNAEAKGPILGGAVLSADGHTLFVAALSGVLAVDTESLRTRSTLLSGWQVDSMRLSADGAWLYVARAGDSSKLWQINPASGVVAAEVPGVNQPWAVLWAEPES